MSGSVIPTLSASSRARELFTGLVLPLRALGLIFRTPRLFALSLLAALVTALALVALAVLLWPFGQSLADRLVGHDATWQRVTSAGLGFLFFALLFVVGALTVPNLLLAPLQDPLSEATEVRCGDFTAPPFSARAAVRGTLESLAHTLLRLSFMLLGFAVLWPLNLVPVAGGVAWVILSSAWSMFWLAVEHLSNPMARHLHPFRQVVGALGRRLPLALGFGAALWVILWVPVVNFFLMPVAVVAGTLLYRGLLAAGALPGPPKA
ncbi:MAG: EI24 domain-containing protein [Myxococcota bacterium]